MKPYTMLASNGPDDVMSLVARLSAWHDAMVAHERRLHHGPPGGGCDDECPHAEARSLWAEAVAAFGPRANELGFLRSRALGTTRRSVSHDAAPVPAASPAAPSRAAAARDDDAGRVPGAAEL